MTAAEADQKAAAFALDAMARMDTSRASAELIRAIGRIETWLRRRAVGGDKILTRQLERPTGRQVKASPKQARKLGIPEK